MTTIGFIGAGNIAGAIARLAVPAGYDVLLSNSRDPETLTELAAEIGGRSGTPAEAAQADITVVATPIAAFPSLPAVSGMVIDVCNYFPERFGHIPELDDRTTTTSELLTTYLPDARVVKTFSNISYPLLAVLGRAAGDPERSALPIAGDDADAKAVATALVDAIGFDAVDVGSLADGWRFQRHQPAWVAPYSADEPGTWPPQLGRQVDRTALAELLAAAQR